MAYSDHGYGRPSWRPRVLHPAMYRSGTPRVQYPAVSRWHAHLHGLVTAIHETSGLAAELNGAAFLSGLTTQGRELPARADPAESHCSFAA